MEKNFEAKTVGLFGTCGNSKWRDPFIKKLNQLGVTYYNPCRDDCKENFILGGTMQLSKMKNIIVLRGMSSNVVDEAIVVLKPNIKLKQSEYNSKGKMTSIDKNKKMIVTKEAENTINLYIKKLQNL